MNRILYTGCLSDYYYKNNEIPHTHKYWEIIYYTHGSGLLKIGDQEIAIEPGVIVCQPPNIPHSEISTVGYKSIFLSVETPNELHFPILYFNDNENKDLYNLMNMIHREFQRKSTHWQEITDALFNCIFCFLSAWSNTKGKNPLVEQFENVLIRNILNKEFNLNHAMQAVPLSVNHFRYLFKKETGMTPLEYFTEKKIEYSKYLIENTNNKLSFKEVADCIGLDNQYYFSRVFKKVMGVCPKEWKMLQTKSE